jgi:hypothetical protein
VPDQRAGADWNFQTPRMVPGTMTPSLLQMPDAVKRELYEYPARISSVAEACATCKENPCAALACGIPGSKYRGGAHGCMTGTGETTGDGLDSHHMPARSKSPLHPAVGPAIQMDPADHAQTASFRGKVNGPSYAPQRALLAQGKTYAAFVLDAADARRIAMASGDPTKYDGAIAQATAYATCLKKNGIIQ